jgi:hypothetical protein
MEKYLDITSLIKSDFYKKNQRLSWHISHTEYNKLSSDLNNLLENLEFDKIENEIFQIVKFDIFSSLSQYLSHVYDFILLSRQNIKPIYSRDSNIYIDPIWQKRPIMNTFVLDLQKRRKKNNIFKYCYSKMVKNISKNFFKFIVVSENQLSKEFNKGIQYECLKILPTYYFPINVTKNRFTKNLSDKISSLIFLMVSENYFYLSLDHKKSINFIIEIYLSRAFNDLKIYDDFLKKTQNIITGTGNNYYNRLISNLAKKHGSKIWRFNHGGDRCFFDDNVYWKNEFFQTDIYITYGVKWADYLKKKAKQFKKDIHIDTIESRYHKRIFNLHFSEKKAQSKKILYIPNSFVSEGRQFQTMKIVDPVLYDWQKYLLEILKRLKYDVIYKTHPKGFYQEINNLDIINKNKTNKSMIESLEYADTVILDYLGSAFVEALCAGKDIIYIDMKQRLYDKENINEFKSFVKVISTYIKDGIFYLNEDELKEAINSPHKDIKKQEQIVRDYFL